MLFLRKAAQDEALLDAVIESDKVSDEVIGFHCQQAAEKMLKALLSELGQRAGKTIHYGSGCWHFDYAPTNFAIFAEMALRTASVLI